MIVNSNETLPKPPRLISMTTGYDWNEFDRWMQRLYLMLGNPNENRSMAFNVIQQLDDHAVSASFDFAVDHQHEIKMLDKRIDDLVAELNMIIDRKQEIISLNNKIEDLQTEMNLIVDHQQEIRNLQQQIQDIDTAHTIGV